MKPLSLSSLPQSKQRLAIVALLLVWCVALNGYWIYRAWDRLAVSMLWNLFLASVPLLWSSAFQSSLGRKPAVLSGIYFFLWLIFFPNAPYLLTDLIHLGERPNTPLWYLMAVLLFCAGTGTLLGYLSLLDIHAAIERRWGNAIGWSVVTASLMLCGFGIYVGRFLRWNSWDALTNPLELFKSMAGQFVDAGPFPHPIPVTIIFGVGLIIGYIAMRVLAIPASTK